MSYYVNASYDFAIDAIKKLDASKLEEKVKERTLELTRLAWVMKAFAHQTHHRGQTVIYIRLAQELNHQTGWSKTYFTSHFV